MIRIAPKMWTAVFAQVWLQKILTLTWRKFHLMLSIKFALYKKTETNRTVSFYLHQISDSQFFCTLGLTGHVLNEP
jgi:hypothetical protein